MQGIDDQLFAQHRQDAAAHTVFFNRRIVVRNFVHGNDCAHLIGGASQQIIAGNVVKIRSAHDKFQPAFPDTLLVMRQKRLRYAQGKGSLLLADAAFFAQQRENPGECTVHVVCHLNSAFNHKWAEKTAVATLPAQGASGGDGGSRSILYGLFIIIPQSDTICKASNCDF